MRRRNDVTKVASMRIRKLKREQENRRRAAWLDKALREGERSGLYVGDAMADIAKKLGLKVQPSRAYASTPPRDE